MADIGKKQMQVNGTVDQTATSADGHPGGGRSSEMRKLGLQRRRAKGFDDIPGNPRDDARRDFARKKKGKKKKGP